MKTTTSRLREVIESSPSETFTKEEVLMLLEDVEYTHPDEISSDGVSLNTRNYMLYTEVHKPVKLKKTQFEILKFLMLNPNVVITREDIMSNCWKEEGVGVRIIDVTISELRKMVGPERIKTLTKVGYMWE